MKVSYDHVADAMYIDLTGHVALHTKEVNENVLLHFDEDRQLAGIELLFVRQTGIDPLTLLIEHLTADAKIELPDPEMIAQKRREVTAIRKQKAEQQTLAKTSNS